MEPGCTVSVLAPSQEELLRLWTKVQEKKKRRSAYLKTEQGKAYNCDKAKKYYNAHKDAVSDKRRAYYEKNKERMLAYQKEYHKKRLQECKKVVPEGQTSVLDSLASS